jgi:hypothetical protein
MHFPNLLSITVDDTDPNEEDEEERPPIAVDHSLTEFLLSHDTVEELYLDDSLSFDVSLLNASALPRLRRFKGPSNALDVLVKARLAGALRQIQIHFIPSTLDSANQIFTTLQSSKGTTASVPSRLPMLRQIEIENYYNPIPFLVAIVGGCARLFGSTLEEFKVSMILEDVEDGQIIQHASVFRQFTQLRVLRIAVSFRPFYRHERDAFRANMLQKILPLIRELVSQCPALHEIRVYFHPLSWEHTWHIAGTPDSRDGHCPSDGCDAHTLYLPNPPTPSASCASTALAGDS